MFKTVDEYIDYVYHYINGEWKHTHNEGESSNEESTDSEMESERSAEDKTEENTSSNVSSAESNNASYEELVKVTEEIRDDLVVVHQQLAGTHLFLGVLLGAFLIGKMMERWGVKL